MTRLAFVSLITGLLILFDLYVFQAVRAFNADSSVLVRRIVFAVYWALTIFSVAVLLLFVTGGMEKISMVARNFFITIVFANLLFKILMFVFLILEDVYRVVRLGYDAAFTPKPVPQDGNSKEVNLISRSEFVTKTALAIASTPVVAMSFGIISGAYDYRVRKVKLHLPHLPSAFHGMKIGQLSDIHSGSFYNKKAVVGGIEMMNAEKPDLFCFTGDLVNNTAEEAADYVSVFSKLKAPMGTYSTLGNHDYGDYVQWPSLQAKQKNLNDLKRAHKEIGWKLLMNEHVLFGKEGEQLGLIGIENFGAKGHFPKYGKLDLAYEGASEAQVKVLLSHDPSHWDFQVRPQYPDIDLMLAGHTHGMQFGVDTKYLKWSPVQYMYKQWGGMYTEGKQSLYVNRGFGFLGYPGRIGILPEITIIELSKS